VLNAEDILVMIEAMARQAEDDAGDEEGYWDGWADGLRSLARHIRTGVKASGHGVQSLGPRPRGVTALAGASCI
jgi:hypothetical protein